MQSCTSTRFIGQIVAIFVPSCHWFSFYRTSSFKYIGAANLDQLKEKLKNASPEEKFELILEKLENGSERERGPIKKIIKFLTNVGSLIKKSPLDNSAMQRGEFHNPISLQ